MGYQRRTDAFDNITIPRTTYVVGKYVLISFAWGCRKIWTVPKSRALASKRRQYSDIRDVFPSANQTIWNVLSNHMECFIIVFVSTVNNRVFYIILVWLVDLNKQNKLPKKLTWPGVESRLLAQQSAMLIIKVFSVLGSGFKWFLIYAWVILFN